MFDRDFVCQDHMADRQATPRPFILYALSNIVNWFIRDILYPHQGVQLVRAHSCRCETLMCSIAKAI